jgi:type IV secretory pathway VirB2 component (pilin)
MKTFVPRSWLLRLGLFFTSSFALMAQADPWTATADAMMTAFTGPIANALILVAIVMAGLTFAFSEGQGKRQLAGVVFGGAMAVSAARFAAWAFA